MFVFPPFSTPYYFQAQDNRTTDSIKINRSGHIIRMNWTNFWQPTVHVQENIFGNTQIEDCSSHLYASFVTFCVQIDQLFATQWAFEHSEEFRNRRHFPSIEAISWFSKIFQRLTVPRIIHQFGHKKVPKEAFKFVLKTSVIFFQRYFVVQKVPIKRI